MVFLPPLLFEAGWTMKWTELQGRNFASLYAVGGVLSSIAGLGALHQFMGVPWMTALLVGACLAATDSAVMACFEK